MKAKPAHLLVNGEPLCREHLHLCRHGGVYCDFPSTAKATAAARLLREHTTCTVEVAPGPCPEANR